MAKKKKKKPMKKQSDTRDESQLQKASSWVLEALTPKPKKEH